ncbi:hypothetical protein WBG99_17065 [Streptomyces sp. TG1A-60]|uniref:hypothetical protein n=1 Tax=Streptomyces sp. TG1A-60 TaxID=3129111 RepID=UPI0030CD5C50
MKLAVLVAVLLIAGAVVAVVARRRSVDRPGPASGLDAEADANRWVVRLGGSLAGTDVRAQAGAGGSAAQSLTEAAEHLRTARAQLAEARTSDQYTQVTRTAVEGLRHVHAARTALGVDPGAQATDRTAVSGPLDHAVRVVRRSEPSRTGSRSVTAAS